MAPIENAVTREQIDNSYKDVQSGMGGQKSLLSALQGQGGLANQTQNYNQLQGVINGTGPNPAQAMLNQSTGQNVANQGALMAGQRGAGSNVGLLARQAGMVGASTQQQAAGQAATLQANQSLNALGAAGQMANTQAGNQINQTNQNVNSQQGLQQNLLNANQGFQSNQVANYGNVNNANAGMAGNIMGGQQQMIGGMLSGAGKAMAMAQGGAIQQQPQGPTSEFGKGIQGLLSGVSTSSALDKDASSSEPKEQQSKLEKGSSDFSSKLVGALGMSRGGSVPALVSPGEKYLSPQQVQAVKAGANPMKVGETIPGQPKVGGAKNSYSNDTVKKTLQEGGVVVPRSVTKSKNPDRNSAEFVAKVLAKRK